LGAQIDTTGAEGVGERIGDLSNEPLESGNDGRPPWPSRPAVPPPSSGWQERERDFRAAAQLELVKGARSAWGELVRDLMPWHAIINAATFDDRELGYPVSRQAAVRRFLRFFEHGRRALLRPLEGFMACEVGPAGGLEHGHGLLALGGGLRDGDYRVLSRVWREIPGNGFIRFEEMRANGGFEEYVSKHTVKQMGDVVFSLGCGRVWYEGWG
jgi:hypothetical protein